MTQGFRQSMAWLHTWSALLPGWLLYFIFLTGTAGYFASEIDRWMQPELPLRQHVEPIDAVTYGLQRLHEKAPHATRWAIELPDRNHVHARFTADLPWTLHDMPPFYEEKMAGDVAEQIVKPRDTGGGHTLYQMHWGLQYLPQQAAYWIVGVAAMSLLLALVSGVIVHRRIFKDFFTFRPGKGARSWLNAHSILGVLALPFYLMVAYTGLVLLMSVYLPQLMWETANFDNLETHLFNRAFNQLDARDLESFQLRPANVDASLTDVAALVAEAQRDGEISALVIFNPGDVNARIVIFRVPSMPLSRQQQLVYDGTTGKLLYAGAAPFPAAQINQVMTGLHEAVYAGPLLRCLYFISGLMGAGMIATGMVLWTVKRRNRHREARSQRALTVVERLNVGILAGLPVAIAAYFWANRLLPVNLPQRAAWEMHALFLTWALLLLYASARPLMRSWFELLYLAAAAYGLLPLLNALTTDRHLGVTLAHDGWHGDWALAGFDLTAMGLGLLFAAIAWRLRKKVEALPHMDGVLRFDDLQMEIAK